MTIMTKYRSILASFIIVFVAISLSAQEKKATVKFTNPPALSVPRGYSHVVEVSGGKMVYVSGQLAFDKDGNMVGKADFRAQAKQVYENLKAALQAVGATFEDVIKLNTYLTDMSQLVVLREVRAEYLTSKTPPVSTTVEVHKLAREEAMIEIEAVAVLR